MKYIKPTESIYENKVSDSHAILKPTFMLYIYSHEILCLLSVHNFSLLWWFNTIHKSLYYCLLCIILVDIIKRTLIWLYQSQAVQRANVNWTSLFRTIVAMCNMHFWECCHPLDVRGLLGSLLFGYLPSSLELIIGMCKNTVIW